MSIRCNDCGDEYPSDMMWPRPNDKHMCGWCGMEELKRNEALVTNLLSDLAEKDAEIERLRAALSAAKELFEDECTPDERDSFVWLMQTEELLGR